MPYEYDMMSTPTRVGKSSTAGKSIKKQHSESFSATPRRISTHGSLHSRPTSEFGWQLALQGLPLGGKEPVLEEEPHETWSEAQKASRLDGAAAQEEHSPSPPPHLPPTYRAPPPARTRTKKEESTAESSLSNSKQDIAELSQRYNGKDIGWQVGLQGQHIPPSEEERIFRDEDTNPYSGADLGSRESPRLESKALPSSSKHDVFTQLNLEEAARRYPAFSTSESKPFVYPSRPTAQAKPAKKDFLNNPMHAIRLQEEAAKLSNGLIDLDDDRPLPPVPRHRHSPPPQKSPNYYSQDVYADWLDCQYCPKRVPLTEVSQISECLHVICHSCLVTHVENQISDSHFPIKCPMCLLLEEPSNVGIISVDIVDQLPLPRTTVDIFLEFEISANSSSICCPKCQETMRVERSQYLEEAVITCPVEYCGHKWCKLCLKEMSGSTTKHKCKPSKKAMIRPCPGCGTQARRVADDNYIQCRGINCHLHFCFKCGDTIADESSFSDVPAAVTAHYKKCTRHTKADKCKVQ